MKLTEYKPSTTHRVLVYGAPKTGKTTAVGKLASSYGLDYLDLENGANSLVYNIPAKDQDNINVIEIPDTKEYPIAIETILKIFTGQKVKICERHGKVACMVCQAAALKADAPTGPEAISFNELELATYPHDRIIVIDSATQLTNSCMNNICKGKGDDYKPDWEDWRKLGAILDRVFSQIQQAHYNVVVISHETLVEMEDGKKKLVPIAGTSNFSKTFAKYFDDVIYTDIVNRRHRCMSSSTASNGILTGSRSNIDLEKLPENLLANPLLAIFKPELLTPTK
jgi:hypothetical protein